jgi:hypothetical protein
MKYIWESSDIKAGVFFRRKSLGITGVYLIGYMASATAASAVPEYRVISLSDGCVMNGKSPEEIASALNDEPNEPLTREQVASILVEAK